MFECDIQVGGKWSQPKKLSSNINSKFKELSVSIASDGKTLYFSSDREGGFGGVDIYRCKLENDGDWGPAENLGSSINTEYDEDAPFIDSDSKTLYFSSRGHKGIGGYDIYKSVWEQTRRSWQTPQNMGYPLNSPDDDIYFVLAGDKKTGYYASAKGDGFGDKDIYKIYLKADENDFSMLKKETEAKEAKIQQEYVALPTLSLGAKKKKNIPNQSISPQNTETANSKTEINLPISTKSTTSKDGGDNTLSEKVSLPNTNVLNTTQKNEDIAKQLAAETAQKQAAKKVADSLTDAKNAEIERAKIQLAQTASEKLAAETAQKLAAKEEARKIYEEKLAAAELAKQEAAQKLEQNKILLAEKKHAAIELAKENARLNAEKAKLAIKKTVINGNVYDHQTAEPISNAIIVLSDLKGNKIAELETDKLGNFKTEVAIKQPTKYSITVNKQAYIYQNFIISVLPVYNTNKAFVKDFALKQVGVGQVFVLRNIYYEFDKSNIKKESFQYLDKLASWLHENPTLHIEIGGHTDIKGMETYNKVLSQTRVNAVMLYLTAKGIGGERLSAIGYGSERPLASNDDENEGREINRRTEFRIVK